MLCSCLNRVLQPDQAKGSLMSDHLGMMLSKADSSWLSVVTARQLQAASRGGQAAGCLLSRCVSHETAVIMLWSA